MIDKRKTFYSETQTFVDRVIPVLSILLPTLGVEFVDRLRIFDGGCCTGITTAQAVLYYWQHGIWDVQAIGCDVKTKSPQDNYTNPNLQRYVQEIKNSFGIDLALVVDIKEFDYTEPLTILPWGIDLALLLNNYSYEVYYHPEILSDPEAIRQRLWSVFDVLAEGGIMVIWSEHPDCVTAVLKKVEDRAIPVLGEEACKEYLRAYYGPTPGFSIDEKSERDTHLTQIICNALNNANGS